MTIFYFVRHGQTWANQQGIKQGILDDEQTRLTEFGQQQTRQLRTHFQPAIDHIICSPLRRAQETAKILNDHYQLPIQLDSRLTELGYGQWTGQATQMLMNQFPDDFDDYIQDVALTLTSKKLSVLHQQVQAFLIQMTQKFPNDNLLVVTHGWIIKMAALLVLQGERPTSLLDSANDSVTKIIVDADTLKTYLSYYNQCVSPDFR
ncbi:histidine phosphatase family protein [Levilactobacillus brevis]|uniref:histidine phosphatase family protein n=1 Tax=Levilactobacillus brevis TaxID=1580 RepID=UPI0021A782BE|nr:histidine phosphatase family protein [Levilactobacillus brevis]MCT3567052.1 histidine phosphatase family protein [Levilactobacillus brevis]